MNDFRSTEDIVKVERLENKELLHEYFLLDLALVLIDSIDQVPPFNSFLFISVSYPCFLRLRLPALPELFSTVLKEMGALVVVGAVGERRCPRSLRRQGLNMGG